MNIFVNMLSWCNIVHDVGIMYHCSILSPELVVLSDEILEMLKVIRRGIQVDRETLALDVIRNVGPGGHYLNPVSYTHLDVYKRQVPSWRLKKLMLQVGF